MAESPCWGGVRRNVEVTQGGGYYVWVRDVNASLFENVKSLQVSLANVC
jgi:hypothetical protein